MVTFPCPWCEQELVVATRAELESHVRCDDCATVVDLAPTAASDAIATLPLAA
jgi:hypothetical protein